jgi:hypothetical protein
MVLDRQKTLRIHLILATRYFPFNRHLDDTVDLFVANAAKGAFHESLCWQSDLQYDRNRTQKSFHPFWGSALFPHYHRSIYPTVKKYGLRKNGGKVRGENGGGRIKRHNNK